MHAPRPAPVLRLVFALLFCAAPVAHGAATPSPVRELLARDLPVAQEQRAWARELAADLGGELLDERSVKGTASNASTSSSASASSSASTASSTSSSSPSSSSSSSSSGSFEMPEPFDQVLSQNFTSSTCPVFLNNFLADDSFQQCTNLWLLMESSTAYFNMLKGSANTSVDQVLDSACSSSPGEDACESVMGRIATAMRSNSACGKDLAAKNPLPVMAMQGLLSYKVMRDATCLKDNSTGAYCYAEAMEDDSPMNAYLYQLAAGTSLPSAIKPTCDACSSDLMGVFSKYALNTSLSISSTYNDAQQLLALDCGPTFAPRILPTNHENSSAVSPLSGVKSALLALVLGALVHVVS